MENDKKIMFVHFKGKTIQDNNINITKIDNYKKDGKFINFDDSINNKKTYTLNEIQKAQHKVKTRQYKEPFEIYFFCNENFSYIFKLRNILKLAMDYDFAKSKYNDKFKRIHRIESLENYEVSSIINLPNPNYHIIEDIMNTIKGRVDFKNEMKDLELAYAQKEREIKDKYEISNLSIFNYVYKKIKYFDIKEELLRLERNKNSEHLKLLNKFFDKIKKEENDKIEELKIKLEEELNIAINI